jgi:hypothetical protein
LEEHEEAHTKIILPGITLQKKLVSISADWWLKISHQEAQEARRKTFCIKSFCKKNPRPSAVQKPATKRHKKHKEELILHQIILLKISCIFSGAAQVQKAST